MKTHSISRFNIRVYGLWINDQHQVMVVDEYIQRKLFTKFPGGGLEYGEGIRDCMFREWQEETGMALLNCTHFYTTDFFQPSAFNSTEQIISIYFLVEPNSAILPEVPANEIQLKGFRWLNLSPANHADISLPIDQHVFNLLLES